MSPLTPDKMNSCPVKTKMILALMRALWGEVSPALRAASVKLENQTIYLFFFYDGEISDEDHDSAECIATEVIASFPEHKLEVEIKRIDCPILLPNNKGDLVYKRRENKQI